MIITAYIIFTMLSILLVNISHNLLLYIVNTRTTNRNYDLNWKYRWIGYSLFPYINIFICVVLVFTLNNISLSMKNNEI